MSILVIEDHGQNPAELDCILVIGDSWIDYLPELPSDKYTVCGVPGASLYTLKSYLEMELMMADYSQVVIIGGKNGVDLEILSAHQNIKLIRNDKFPDKYLLDDKTHPNSDGIQEVLKIINQRD
ncbi:Hypothetical protein HVR_LOCUS23 [uncultured virus]|nr:Hypothetical protein HVR_LOCUS23 [uncultured virus]